MAREVELLKPRIKDPKLDKRNVKELLIRLIYIDMMGHDASWSYVYALQSCSDSNLMTKKVTDDTLSRLTSYCLTYFARSDTNHNSGS